MIAASEPRTSRKLLVVDSHGRVDHRGGAELATLFRDGDLLVANDAATLPASLRGVHGTTGTPVEVRLAGWARAGDPSRFVAIVFGSGDYRTPTEERPDPPSLRPGDRLLFGSLLGLVERTLEHPRQLLLRFIGSRRKILAGLARHGRPIQYAHTSRPLEMWDVWTAVAAEPFAFEPPSAGFALDWSSIESLRTRGVGVTTLTHAAGISSTGDMELDRALPFDEAYSIPRRTSERIANTRRRGGRIVAVGTTVVRALESAAGPDGSVRSGDGIATGRIGPESCLRVVDAILTGIHPPGESHFELLRAFADAPLLLDADRAAREGGYRSHEFGDSMLLARQPRTRGCDRVGGEPVAVVRA